MYGVVLEALKGHLADTITLPKQVEYLAKTQDLIAITAPLVLIEPGAVRLETKDTVWKRGPWEIKLWAMVEITTDYMLAMGALEDLLGAADDQAQRVGLEAALGRMRENQTYAALAGTFGGKRWRVNVSANDFTGPTFNTYKLASRPMVAAVMDLRLGIEKER